MGTQQAPLRWANTFHLCLDMQRLFSAGGSWPTPWMARVLPEVIAVAQLFRERSIFTRFIPATDPDREPGTWRHYYRRWSGVTLDQLDPAEIRLIDELQEFVPPAHLVDKRRFSAFSAPELAAILNAGPADTLVLTGGETDMCVLATVMDGLDRGFRIVLVEDAVCSSSDAGHDAAMTIYRSRFVEQISVVNTKMLAEQLEA